MTPREATPEEAKLFADARRVLDEADVQRCASLLPYKTRVIAELAELDAKRNALRVFLDTPTFEQLPVEECVDLVSQFEIMRAYASILARRISRFMP